MARLQRKALAKLKWLVVRDMVETETASLLVAIAGSRTRRAFCPKTSARRSFCFRPRGHAEKDGSFTNTQRLLQFREKAVDPPGDARSETVVHVSPGAAVEEKAAERRCAPAQRRAARSHLGSTRHEGQHAEPDVEEMLKEINGWIGGRPQATESI